MTTVSINISNDICTRLEEFGTLTQASSEALEGYSYIRSASWNELWALFSKEEAWVLIDILREKELLKGIQGRSEILHRMIKDADEYKGYCSQHGANLNDLLNKTDELTCAQVWVLQREIIRRWELDEINTIINHLAGLI